MWSKNAKKGNGYSARENKMFTETKAVRPSRHLLEPFRPGNELRAAWFGQRIKKFYAAEC